jgi:proline iminopeptidase
MNMAFMKHKALKAILYSTLLGLVVFLLTILFPRKYDVSPFQARKGTLYWDLSTGSRIGYTKIAAKGEKKPFPILYLQGGPGTPIFDRNIDVCAAFAENGYEVYLYDPIGTGHSDRLSDINEYSHDRHKRDLEAIVQTIGTEKVILIGQSWGAVLAIMYIADNKDKVAKLILTGPGPIQPSNPTLANMPSPDSLQLQNPPHTNQEGNKKAQNMRTRFVTWCATVFGKKLASDTEMDNFQTFLNSELNKSIVCTETHTPKSPGGSGFYCHVMTVSHLNDIPDPRPKLQNCPTPLLILKGQCDNQKWGFTQEYRSYFPNSHLLVIPNAGHSIVAEQRELYVELIRNFLEK